MPNENSTKTCTKCLVEKPISNFYKSFSSCKPCYLAKVIEYRRSEHGRKMRREYFKQSRKHGKAKETYQRALKKYYFLNHDKRLVKSYLSKAVAKGKIPKANSLKCAQCLNQASHYHHHNGYSQKHKLDVIPLCLKCHMLIHHPPILLQHQNSASS